MLIARLVKTHISPYSLSMLNEQQRKKLTIICAAVLVLLGIAYGTVFIISKIYLKPEKIKELIVTQAQKRLNRAVSVGDDISLTIAWDMSPHLTLHNVDIGNTTWANRKSMLKAKELDIHFSLTKLLFKEFHIISLHLKNAELDLESYNNKNNWTFDGGASKEEASAESGIKTSIYKVAVENSVIYYNNDTLTIDKLDYTCKANQTDHYLHIQGKHNKLSIKGTAEIENTDNKIKINIINLQSGKSDLTGNLKIQKETLDVSGEFNAKAININDFLINDSSSTGEYSIPDYTFPVQKLKNANFDVAVKIKKLDLGGVIFSNIQLLAKNIKNVIQFELKPPAKIDNGTLSLKLAYDLKQNPAALTLSAKTSSLELESLLREIFGKSQITGSKLDFSTDLNSRGNSLAALVNNLRGRVLATVGPGEFVSSAATLGFAFTNVLASMVSYDKNKSTTGISCAVANFQINNGIANAKRGIALESAGGNVLGNGMVDLRNGRINFSIVPQNITANPIDLAHFSVAQLVNVTGTLSKPEVKLDATNLIIQGGTAVIAAGLTGGLSTAGLSGLGSLLSKGTAILGKQQPQGSPCKIALDS